MVKGGKLVATGTRLPTHLVVRLLAHKREILALLAAPVIRSKAAEKTRCRYCGERVPDLRIKAPKVPTPQAWRDAASAAPGALTFGDGSVAHAACYEAEAIRRAQNALSPAVLADEAEVMVRGDAP
jgi:hypothetical protein